MLMECYTGKWTVCVLDSQGMFLQIQPDSEPCVGKYFSITATTQNTVLTVNISAIIINQESRLSKIESINK